MEFITKNWFVLRLIALIALVILIIIPTVQQNAIIKALEGEVTELRELVDRFLLYRESGMG